MRRNHFKILEKQANAGDRRIPRNVILETEQEMENEYDPQRRKDIVSAKDRSKLLDKELLELNIDERPRFKTDLE
jgi:tRNA(Ile)-lysidine synthase TilS/MesJ